MAEWARDRTQNNANSIDGNTATISALPDDFVRAFARQAREDARRQAVVAARQERRRQRGITSQGDAIAAAQQSLFNRQAFQAYGVSRPGDEGQRNIAARSYGAASQSLDRRWNQSDMLREYTNRRVARQNVRDAAFADGGVVPRGRHPRHRARPADAG